MYTWFFLKKMYSIFSGFAIIFYSESHLTVLLLLLLLLLFDVRILISSTKVFANDNKVLPSSKLCTETRLMQGKKLFLTVLNRIGMTSKP